jgi:hypothetical protein
MLRVLIWLECFSFESNVSFGQKRSLAVSLRFEFGFAHKNSPQIFLHDSGAIISTISKNFSAGTVQIDDKMLSHTRICYQKLVRARPVILDIYSCPIQVDQTQLLSEIPR